MSYKSKARVGTDEWYDELISKGKLKSRFNKGKCVFCGKSHNTNFCNNCWKERGINV